MPEFAVNTRNSAAVISLETPWCSSLSRQHDIICVGGFGPRDQPLRTVKSFNTATGRWSPDSLLVTARAGAAVAMDTHTNTVYVFGGRSGRAVLASSVPSIERYDRDTRQWLCVCTGMTIVRDVTHAVYVAHLKGFFIMGMARMGTQGFTSTDVEFYHVASMTPTQPKPKPCASPTIASYPTHEKK